MDGIANENANLSGINNGSIHVFSPQLSSTVLDQSQPQQEPTYNNEETLYANESRGSQNLIASHQQQLQEETDSNQPNRNEVNSAYSQAAIL